VAVLAVGTDLSLYSGNALQHKISNPGVFNWYDGAGGTRMTLNSTGLGIGESPVSGQKLSVNGAGSIRNGSGLYFWDTGNSTAHGILNTGDNLTFVKNNSTASMTLDASGNLLVNTTTVLDAAHLTVACTAGSGSKIPLSLKVGLDSAGYVAVNLRNQTGSQGTIVVDVTGVRYLTASDYRLKEVLGPISGGLNRVNALKPSVYKWKVDGSNGEGFIAHELAEVVPAAVNGLKDAVNEDGTINPQNVDMSRIVPILVAAIQELTARVQTLEAR
jgi:hypothetical protein